MTILPRRPLGWLLVVVIVAACGAALLGLYAVAPRVDAHPKLFLVAVGATAGALCLIAAGFFLAPAYLVAVGLGLTIFSGDWGYLHLPGPVDRVVVVAGIIAVVVRAGHDPGTPRIAGRRVHWMFVVLLLYATGSAAAIGTIDQHVPLYDLLDRLGVFPFLLFLVAPAAFPTVRARRILLIILAAIGAYLGVLAIFEAIGPQSLVFPRYITSQNGFAGRAVGPFLDPGGDGLALFSSAVASVLLLVEGSPSRWTRRGLVCVIVLCLVGVVLTLTRQVWVAVIAGALIPALVSSRTRRWVPAGIVGMAIIAGGLYAIPAIHHRLVARASDESSVWSRYNSDDAALRMAEARPLLGFGWGGWTRDSAGYYHVARNYPLLVPVSQVHNVFLSNLLELGVVGIALWIAVVVLGLLSPILRRGPPDLWPWKLAALALAIAWIVVSNFAPLSYAFDNYIPWVFAGIAYGAHRVDPNADVEHPAREDFAPTSP